jgi:MerR family transcriptional regulator, light-induced transcriptional regulator
MQEFVGQPGHFFIDPCPRQTGKRPFPRALSDDAPVQVNSAAYAQLLVAEIIPRLFLDCKAILRPPPLDSSWKNTNGNGEATDFRGLASLLLGGESAYISRFIDARLHEGASIETLFAEFLAPAVLRLGTLWEADECDVVEVTIGLHRLHEAVQRLVGDEACQPFAGANGCVLLFPAPGETHRLGLEIVHGSFHSAGWSVERCEATELESSLNQGWFDLVAFSVSCHRFLAGLRHAVVRARQASQNPAILVLVGGAIVAADPSLVRSIGAAIGFAGAEEAIVLAKDLLRRRVRA